MKINIDELTEAELIDLNHRIVEHLRFLNQMRAHEQMLEFKIGDRVTFQPGSHPPVAGMLTRYNRGNFKSLFKIQRFAERTTLPGKDFNS